ncbi:MAG: hypothetical protein GF308_16860 [Candidatus Heimdallarchaeota archaeon]|nr:hypothetical protein [Candidatus Heimdallarchaeota archaeon]
MILLVEMGLFSHPISSYNDLNFNGVDMQNNSSGDITFTYPKSISFNDNNYWNLTNLLDINQSLDRINSFEAAGVSAYTGDQIVPGIDATKHLIRVSLLNATIYNDHDIGEGEIYFNITINGNFTETERYTAEDGDTIDINLNIFYAWCLKLDIIIEVWEDDTSPTPDDELGTFTYNTTTPSGEIISGLTDIEDAKVWLEIEVIDSDSDITAEFLADGCKPYFYISDESPATEEPDEVYSRVLIGKDNETMGNKDIICIQYLFYWIKENFPVPINTQFHEDDYEEFLIFIDPADLYHPYRYVFDDGSYVSNTRSSRLAIWENHPTTDINETTAFVTQELTPLLGGNVTTDYKIFNLDEASNELRTGLSGIGTMNLIIQTSFHNFQEGPPGLFDLSVNEIGYNYSLSQLNDLKIREFFRRHYHAFEEGLWFISTLGKDTPKVHPFTFDIMNPFDFPYLINGYPNVVENIKLFQEANDNFIDYQYNVEFTTALIINARYTIIAPDSVIPGDDFDVEIEVEILEDGVEIGMYYDFLLNGTIKALFLDKNFLFDYDGKVEANIPMDTLSNMLTLLSYRPLIKDGLALNVDNYLSLDQFSLSSNLLGDIMQAEASLHLWEIIKHQLPILYPPVFGPLHVLDYFMDAIDFKLDTSLQGFLNGTISSSDQNIATLTKNSFNFDGSTSQTLSQVSVAETATSGTSFDIILDDLLFTMSFFTDWFLQIDFMEIIALLAPEYGHMTFDIGTFPNVNFTSDDSVQYPTTTTSVSKQINIVDKTGKIGVRIFGAVTSLLSIMIVLVFIKRIRK